jgi:hypothetical protein
MIDKLIIEALRNNGGEDLDYSAARILLQDFISLVENEIDQIDIDSDKGELPTGAQYQGLVKNILNRLKSES